MAEKIKLTEEEVQKLKEGSLPPLGAGSTAAISGKAGSITGPTGASEITEWSCAITAEALEATSMASGGWREFIVGLEGATGSLTCIGTRPKTETVASLVLKTKATGGGITISGKALISSVETSVAVDGVVTFSADYSFTGEVSVA